MGASEFILIMAMEVVLIVMGVRALQLVMHREPRVLNVYLRLSARMHERPWLLYRIPLAVFTWGILAGAWEAVTSNDGIEATLRLVFPLVATIALVLTILVWRLHSAEETGGRRG
jgi:uncharacterized membrane protein